MRLMAVPAAIAAILVLSACEPGQTSTQDQAVLGGAAAGALISGASSGFDGRQTLIGAGVGALAGAVLAGATSDGQCTYRNQDGSTFKAACPQ